MRAVDSNPLTNKGEYVVVAADERPFNTNQQEYFLKRKHLN